MLLPIPSPSATKTYDVYRLAIETGMKHDPRPKEEVDSVLSKAKKAYDELPDDRKELFDTESLWNPYYDCRFAWGEELAKEAEAERFMWGVDITDGELLLADRLREKGQRIDAVVAHHPTGRSRNPFPKVMWMQTDIFHDCGVPINVADGLLNSRMDDVMQGVMGSNYNMAADCARLLNIPFFNIHSAADNMVQEYLERKVEGDAGHTGDMVSYGNPLLAHMIPWTKLLCRFRIVSIPARYGMQRPFTPRRYDSINVYSLLLLSVFIGNLFIQTVENV